jgi:hypothetical protein
MDVLVQAIEENEAVLGAVKSRLQQAHDLRVQGLSYGEMATRREGKAAVEILNASIEALADAGSRLRLATALELRAEGMTMEGIARLFGVSRQRIAAILKETDAR